jgi:Ca2+-dependent lipid-binding protein
LAAGPSSARALVIDSTPASNLPAPTISVDDINRASREEGEGFGGEKVEPVASSTQEVENLQKSTIGWLDSIGGVKSPNSITESSESIQRTPSRNWFTENIPLEFYGTAYHNAGLILFAVLSTRAITLLRLSWGWIVVLLAFCMTMYSISIERTRARARDDIQRELMKSRLVSESESADWINSLLDRAWLIAEPLLSGESLLFVLQSTHGLINLFVCGPGSQLRS